jgi:type IV pilus assembly protein PilY1
VDFVYAGDLKGNLWKFDLRNADPNKWEVAYSDGDTPKPLFQAPGQPITAAPDVMYHCDKDGYMVIFGTGKYLGKNDSTDTSQQTIFGIWDTGMSLGTWNRAEKSLSNMAGVELLEQEEIDWRSYAGSGVDSYLRTLSDNTPHWYTACDNELDDDGDGRIDEEDKLCTPVSPASYANDGIDNDYDGDIDENDEYIGHAGWYFDLPYTTDGTLAGERVIKDVIIRDGKAIVLSFIPNESPCSGGGNSIVHEMTACTGGRLSSPVFDINGDHSITEDDYIEIDGIGSVPPTGRMYPGLIHVPVVATDPDRSRNRELKIFSSSSGTTEIMWEKREQTGLYYWREY